MPFGSLKVFGINPQELEFEIEPQKKGEQEKALIFRTKCRIKGSKNWKSLQGYVEEAIRKQTQQEIDLPMIQFAPIFSAIAYDIMEKSFNAELMAQFVKGRMKDKFYSAKEKLLNANEKVREKFSLEIEAVRKKYKSVRKNYQNAIAQMDTEIIIKLIPNIKNQKIINKILKNLSSREDLTLSDLLLILNAVKKNKGKIGSEGTKLIKSQMKKFGEKVTLSAEDPKKLNALRNDFEKAFDVKKNGEFGNNGLKKHVGKKIRHTVVKICKKILRCIAFRQSEYAMSKEARVAATEGFARIDHLLEIEIKEKESQEHKKLAETSSSGVAAKSEPAALQLRVPSTEQPKATVQPAIAGPQQPGPESTTKDTGAEKSVPELRRGHESRQNQSMSATSSKNPMSVGAEKSASTLIEQFEPKRKYSATNKPKPPQTPRPKPLPILPKGNSSLLPKLIDLAKDPPQQQGSTHTTPPKSTDEHHGRGPH